MSPEILIPIAVAVIIVLGAFWIMRKEFKILAQKALDESSAKFKADGVERIQNAVSPLLRDIGNFRALVDQSNKDAIARSADLRRQVLMLAERTASVTAEANNLAAAINGQAQVSGQWAEIGLKRVLELSGLVENVDYTYQETFSGEDSIRRDLRTDILVKMPGDRWVVVDSKNTVRSYTQYVDAEGVDKEELRKDIVRSLRTHVDELKAADYPKNIKRAFDCSLMYIPFEEVYLIALKSTIKVGNENRLLRDYAIENHVLFVNATSLLPILRSIQMAWVQQDMDKKAHKVIDECGKLCDKVNNFLESYQSIGKNLAGAVRAYNTGLGQLATGPGNILKRVQDFRELGVESARDLKSSGELEATAAKIPELASR